MASLLAILLHLRFGLVLTKRQTCPCKRTYESSLQASDITNRSAESMPCTCSGAAFAELIARIVTHDAHCNGTHDCTVKAY